MSDIALVDVIKALRREISDAIAQAGDSEIRFAATQVDLEFKVGVQRTSEGRGGIKFWVLELGGGGSRTAENVQTVKLSLQPVMARGERVMIADAQHGNPLQHTAGAPTISNPANGE